MHEFNGSQIGQVRRKKEKAALLIEITPMQKFLA